MQGVRVSSGCENRSHAGRYQGGATVETEASLEGERTGSRFSLEPSGGTQSR